MSLMLGIYESPGGALMLDASPFVLDCSFSTGEHGFADLRATMQLSLAAAFNLYTRGAALHVAVFDNARAVWEGRLEDTGIRAGDNGTTLEITALGRWAALSDAPYTALWSDTSTGKWEPVLPTLVSSSLKDRFVFDTDNRLFISPKLNSVQGGGVVAGLLGYTPPSGGQRQIVGCDFSYTCNLPANWTCRLDRFDSSWAYLSTAWTLAATGATLTGTQTLTFTGCDNLAFQAFYSLGSATHTGQDGDFFLRITAPRVRGSTSPTIFASEIATGLVAFIAGINPTDLSSSTALIASPAIDLTDELYQDALPSDILSNLASYTTWETGVYDNRQLYFRARGTAGQTWFVDATSLDLQRTIAALYNSAYAVYKDVSGREVRSAIATDSASVTSTGLTRRQAVGVNSSSATFANSVRDASLADTKDARPRAAIDFDAVYTASGARGNLWDVRAGDTFTVRNLPLTLGTEIDKIRTFRLSRTTYNAITNRLAVEPEAPLPTVETLLAKR